MLLLDAPPLGRHGSQHGEGQHASRCTYHAHQSQAVGLYRSRRLLAYQAAPPRATTATNASTAAMA